jgi:hypothetical protein
VFGRAPADTITVFAMFSALRDVLQHSQQCPSGFGRRRPVIGQVDDQIEFVVVLSVRSARRGWFFSIYGSIAACRQPRTSSGWTAKIR